MFSLDWLPELKWRVVRHYRNMRWAFWESKVGQFVCGLTDHAPGVVWHNYQGPDPDMHCRRCNKDLG